MLAEDNGYIRAFMDMIKTPDVDMSHITKRSVENQFYSDLITPLPDQIDPSGTQIHILYALKMGEKYRARYKNILQDRSCMNWICSTKNCLRFIRMIG